MLQIHGVLLFAGSQASNKGGHPIESSPFWAAACNPKISNKKGKMVAIFEIYLSVTQSALIEMVVNDGNLYSN